MLDFLLKSAEALGANAILNTCFDDALDVDTLFHGTAVVIQPFLAILPKRYGGGHTSTMNLPSRSHTHESNT